MKKPTPFRTGLPVTLDHTYGQNPRKRRRRAGRHEWSQRQWDDKSLLKILVASLLPLLPILLVLLLGA